VSGNKIIDPTGKVFIVKGIDAVYGAWAGGDCTGYGATNYANFQRDISNAHNAGYNLVRLDTDDSGNGCHTLTQVLAQLDQVVAYANSLGMVAEISQESSDGGANAWLATLASHFASRPMVWIKLANEPNPNSSWASWRTQEQQWDNTVRANGYKGPVVLNCPGWSWDCSPYPSYALTDTDIILGAHRYANGNTSFTAAERAACDAAWANMSASHAVIVDELGNFDFPGPGGAGSDVWNQGILAYISNWVATRGGDGAIAFAQAWSDGNNMINSNGTWNRWGSTFHDYYVAKV
jgi:hypothetical protein